MKRGRNYKVELEQGDSALTKRSAYRHGVSLDDMSEYNMSDDEMSVESSHDNDNVANCNNDFVNNHENDLETIRTIPQDEQSTSDNIADGGFTTEKTHEYVEVPYLEKNNKQNNTKSTFWNPNNLNDFMSSSQFTEIINTPASVTHGELFFLLLKFSVSNHLPTSAFHNLLNLVNTFYESPVLPSSKYVNDKILNTTSEVQFHAICSKCSIYLGEFGKDILPDKCNFCSTEVNLKQSSNDSFFALINPASQIRDLLEVHEDHYENIMKNRVPHHELIEDVYDGRMYQKFRAQLPLDTKQSFVTMVMNTDGAPKFKSSKKSIWPVYLMINELPKEKRLNDVICCALWFNKKKPNMSVFLHKFVEMFNDISENGVLCTVKKTDLLIKPYILSCCVDAPARALVTGMKQYNGHYGCNWCLHPGEADGPIVYPLLDIVPEPRSKEETVQIMSNLEDSDDIMGIKCPSPLINLSYFDIIEGIIPDYLHCCLEGVAARMMGYFMKNLSAKDLENLDNKMLKIRAPNQLQRLTRSISSRNDWKAREWENFILYYSIPILEPLLSGKKFDHWLLFVEGLYIILQEKIEIQNLNRANELFHRFVAEMDENHGKRAMTYNTHILLHICRSVHNWGPVWANSTFPFESANQHVLNAINCAKGVGHQVIRYVNINHSLLVMQNFLTPINNEEVQRYCEEVFELRIDKALKGSDDSTYFGRGSYLQDNISSSLNLSTNSLKFLKMVKNGCVFESINISKNRSNNSYALLQDRSYIKILCFLVDEEKNIELTQCYKVATVNCFGLRYSKMKIVSEIETNTSTIVTKDICKICIFMEIDKKSYICEVPNMLHY